MSSKKRKSPSGKAKIIACLNCRKGHRMCDGLSTCFQCKNRNQICTYPTKSDPVTNSHPLPVPIPEPCYEQTLSHSIERAIKEYKISRQREQSTVEYMICTEEWSDELKKIFNSIESSHAVFVPNDLVFDVIVGCSAISIAYLDTNPGLALHYANCCFNYIHQLIRDIHLSPISWQKKVLLDHLSLQIRLWITMREIEKAVNLSFSFKMIFESIDKTTIYTLPTFLDVFSSALMIWVCQKPGEKLMYLYRISLSDMLDRVEPDILLFTAFCLVCDSKSYDILGQRKLSPLSYPYFTQVEQVMRKIGILISLSQSDTWKVGFNSLMTLFYYRSTPSHQYLMHPVSCTDSWFSFWVLGLTLAIYAEIGQPVPIELVSLLRFCPFANDLWSKTISSQPPMTTIAVNHYLLSTPPETISESSITEESANDYYQSAFFDL